MFNAAHRTTFLRAGLAAACVAGLGLSASAGTALADGGGTTPFIQYTAAYSGGQLGPVTVGTVMDMHYLDPSGQTTERQFCWSPAPIAQPACTTSGTGAPAQTGTQTVTATLNNGQTVTTSFAVAAPNVNLGSGSGPFTPPVPYTANCQISLYADANLDTQLNPISVGQQVGGYYSPRQGVTQVYDYATNTPGFLPSACLTPPTSTAKTYARTITLRANRTTTYKLNLPSGFKAIVARKGATPVGYALYQGNRVGTGVGVPIGTSGTGSHQPFLGATVTRSSFSGNTVSVTVKTTKLAQPLTLSISAYGTA
jgi:hypothetical protein